MAECRMFSKQIVCAGKFLKMPVSARELYFQLGLFADDEGVAEAYNVMALTRTHKEDLQILIDNGYIACLNDDLVVLISDWNINNHIRKDRLHPSIYHKLVEERQINNQPSNSCPTTDNQMTTKCPTTDNQMTTEIRLDKNRLDKNRLDKDNSEAVPPLNKYYPDNEELNIAFSDYVEMRKKMNAPITDAGIVIAKEKLDSLSNGNNKLALEIIHNSIFKNWKDFYLPKNNKNSAATPGIKNKFNNIDTRNQADVIALLEARANSV